MRNAEIKTVDVLVLGAGAAGLMSAFTAAENGKRVLVLEKANKVGKKILMSGGGRCNFTNYVVEADNYISENPHFCKSALKRFTQWDFIGMVNEAAIPFEERKHGQLFCVNSARDILDMLLDRCERAGVEVRTDCELLSVAANQGDSNYLLKFRQSRKEPYQEEPQTLGCHSLIVATGALSIPSLGGSPVGYDIAEQFGLALVERRAGLVPFMFSDAMQGLCSKLSGLALDVTLACKGHSFSEAMLFTHRGISGPVALQVSNYWHPGDELLLNLLPEFDAQRYLMQSKQDNGKSLLKTVLGKHLAKGLLNELQALWWPEYAKASLAEMPDKVLLAIGSNLNAWLLKPSSTEGYRTAEVTLGGVSTEQISSKTMEVKGQPGLYFVGEVLDVSGHLGGFNFQWAWSSGYAAGSNV